MYRYIFWRPTKKDDLSKKQKISGGGCLLTDQKVACGQKWPVISLIWLSGLWPCIKKTIKSDIM